MSNTKPSYVELATRVEKNAQSKKRDTLISAFVFAALLAAIVCLPLTYSFSGLRLTALIVLMVVSAFLSAQNFVFVGFYSAQKHYKPKLRVSEGEFDELKNEFHEYRILTVEQAASHLGEYLSLQSFLQGRSPELFVEYAAWRNQQSQPLSEEDRYRKLENEFKAYRALAEERVEHRDDDYLLFAAFVKVNAPDLFAEFVARQEKRL